MLTQSEADGLIAMAKSFVAPGSVSIPPGADDTHDLIGEDADERFLLDVWRGTIRLSKLRLQTRGRKVIVLVRIDIDGSPHSNPDGVKLPGTHLHLYREGYEDKWAFPVDPNLFGNLTDIHQAFEDFCAYCNIGNVPPFQAGLT